MNILVSNDDGINADGIKLLVKYLSGMAKVFVSAPESQRSATSQSVSFRDEINVEKTNMTGAVEAWAVSGTPIDCVKFGIQKLKDNNIDIDYVISGINMGSNLGNDVHYSGTVGAAMEGAMAGYHSIALSVTSHKAEYFEYICEMVPELLKLSEKLDRSVVLNVNSPNLPKWKIKGVKIVGFNTIYKDDVLVKSKEDEKKYTYRRESEYNRKVKGEEVNSIVDGYTTITPVRTNITDRKSINIIKQMISDSTVCVFLDFQENLLSEMKKSEKLIENTVKFASAAKRLGLPMVVTEQYAKGVGRTASELRKAIGSYQKAEKVTFNSMESSEFRDMMEGFSGKKIILAGIEAHISLQQTAEALVEEGYDVTVLRDCTSSRRKMDCEIAMQYLKEKGCKVTTSEAFLFEFMGSSLHPAFRKISAILKGETD